MDDSALGTRYFKPKKTCFFETGEANDSVGMLFHFFYRGEFYFLTEFFALISQLTLILQRELKRSKGAQEERRVMDCEVCISGYLPIEVKRSHAVGYRVHRKKIQHNGICNKSVQTLSCVSFNNVKIFNPVLCK